MYNRLNENNFFLFFFKYVFMLYVDKVWIKCGQIE